MRFSYITAEKKNLHKKCLMKSIYVPRNIVYTVAQKKIGWVPNVKYPSVQ